MTENEISYLVRGAVFKVYNSVGPGLLESAYEMALTYELKNIELEVRTQVGLPFIYHELQLDIGCRSVSRCALQAIINLLKTIRL
jgi:GxxExxY protein